MVSHPENGSDSPIGSDRNRGRDMRSADLYRTRSADLWCMRFADLWCMRSADHCCMRSADLCWTTSMG